MIGWPGGRRDGEAIGAGTSGLRLAGGLLGGRPGGPSVAPCRHHQWNSHGGSMSGGRGIQGRSRAMTGRRPSLPARRWRYQLGDSALQISLAGPGGVSEGCERELTRTDVQQQNGNSSTVARTVWRGAAGLTPARIMARATDYGPPPGKGRCVAGICYAAQDTANPQASAARDYARRLSIKKKRHPRELLFTPR